MHRGLESLEVGIVVVDAGPDVVFSNAAARRMLGVGPGRFDPGILIHEDGSSCLPDEEPVRRALARGEVSRGVLLGRPLASGTCWLSVDARPFRHRGHPRPYGAVATFVDVTQIRDRERTLRESDQMFRTLAQHSTDGVFRLTPDLRVLYESPGGEQRVGRSSDSSLGQSVVQWLHEGDLELVGAQLELLRGGADETDRFPVRVLHEDGFYLWAEVICHAIRDVQGSLVEIQVTTHDISERVRHEEHLKRLALTDGLTGLANRQAAVDWLRGAQQRDREIALLYLDVDRFKVVNDCLGHEVGDRLLVQVASRLRQVARPDDLLVRLGGDEFVLAREGVGKAEALRLADELAQVLEAPVEVQGHTLAVSASVGIVTGSVSGDPYSLLREADAAMYDAKEQGRARAVVYSSYLGDRAERRLTVETGLRNAFRTGEIVPYYQPIVDLRSGALVGVEALVRWLDPVRGVVGPAEFLPVAEDSGVIIALGRTVITQSVHNLARWRAELPAAGHLELAVNLSGPELSWEDTVPWLLGLVASSGLPPAAVTVEVLESAILSAEPILETLGQLRAGGLRVGLDDFGTGNSSLTNLRRVPCDLVKVDASFVRGLGHDPWDEAIVLATRDLARSFHAEVLAEGVETKEQATWLRERAVPYAQGYLFGPPQSGDEIMETISEQE